MARVLLDMAVSLDGLICGPGGDDGGLYDWYFDPTQISRPVVDELVSTTGAIIIGRGAFGTGDEAGGWEDTPYRVPHFVVTHRPPWRAARSNSSSYQPVCGPQSSSPEKQLVSATQRSAEAPTLPANAWPSAWSTRCSCMWSLSSSAMGRRCSTARALDGTSRRPGWSTHRTSLICATASTVRLDAARLSRDSRSGTEGRSQSVW
jgi:hypothetical protein